MTTAALVRELMEIAIDALEVQHLSERQSSRITKVLRELATRTDGKDPHLESCVCQECTDAFWEMVRPPEGEPGPFD